MEIIDNISKRLFDELRASLKAGGRLNIAASCFSIYAYEALRKELEDVKEVRFLFTEPTFTTSTVPKKQREFYIPKLDRERTLYGSPFEVKLRNELKQKAIARECADWIRRKAVFRSNKTSQVMPGFIVTDEASYNPISEFTSASLGLEQGRDAYTIITKATEAPFTKQFIDLFDGIWNDGDKVTSVTDEVVASIENAYRENSPEFIYFVTLYNIFSEFLEDISEDELPKEATGFRDSVVWGKLYDFQKDAVLAIINKLEKYNGCILADSVGLGKTFTALAVIKYYESRNHSVLVLCPKKLYQNWDTYRQTYVNNPLVKDKLGYKVLYHTDLSRESGDSNGVDLERLNWGAFDLVVIDESHNFRNGGRVAPPEDEEDDDNERMNRYAKLVHKVIREGVKTKVLMLSATPVNNRFNDLRNQLQIAYTDYAKGFDELVQGEEGLHDIFKQAQRAFNEWNRENPGGTGSIADLQQRIDPRFFKLLDAVTIARSRKHIQKFYNTAAIGKFPERLKPISRNPEIVADFEGDFFGEVTEALLQLDLSVYSPSLYILPTKLGKYEKGEKNDKGGKLLGLVERERGILKLIFTLLLKRLESSIAAFRITIDRIAGQMDDAIRAVEEYKANKKETSIKDFDTGDIDEDEDAAMIGQGSNAISIADMDYESWLESLKRDKELLEAVRQKMESMGPQLDNKLATLLNDIREKEANQINAGNRKVIVFTAFTDTANYLYENLARELKRDGLECGLVTGTGSVKTTVELKRSERLDFNKVLTMFSPVSKERDALYPNLRGKDIDILIATDCVSEGQNLQDADYLINYDIHWNPVRIIQRFGRIDRIGSKNDKIQLVNYWPPMEIEHYIDLQGRVQARSKAITLAATGTEDVVNPNSDANLDYRSRQLKEMRKANSVMDLEEVNAGPSITDLGLNEFRMDLLEYIKSGHKVDNTPLGLHAVASANEHAPKGVIYVLKNNSEAVNEDRKNRIHPFYMVYVGEDGHIEIDHLRPKEMLDRMRLVCRGKSKPDVELCRAFNRETKDGLNMKAYSDLLGKAVESIVSTKEKSDMSSLLDGDEGDLFSDKGALKGLDDFELVSFVVVR